MDPTWEPVLISVAFCAYMVTLVLLAMGLWGQLGCTCRGWEVDVSEWLCCLSLRWCCVRWCRCGSLSEWRRRLLSDLEEPAPDVLAVGAFLDRARAEEAAVRQWSALPAHLARPLAAARAHKPELWDRLYGEGLMLDRAGKRAVCAWCGQERDCPSGAGDLYWGRDCGALARAVVALGETVRVAVRSAAPRPASEELHRAVEAVLVALKQQQRFTE
jgi:hypothetical protein